MFGRTNLRLLYYRYKDSSSYSLLIIAFIVSICIILFFQIVLPQLESWFSIHDEVLATRTRIDTINQNINLIKSIDTIFLNNQLDIATSALPSGKDFGPILNAVSDSAVSAGVSLDDYAFQVGDIASISGKVHGTTKDLANVNFTVSVSGSTDGIQNFIKTVGEKLPLSEVTDIEGDTRGTTVTLQFYQKQFPNIVFKDDQPLSPISSKNISLLQQLALWHTNQALNSVSTDSAIPLF